MPQGVVTTETSDGERHDYLFRVALKAYIQNDKGEVLVVKEMGRNAWDLPGGGMDHGETVREALARELKEEVDYNGDFTYQVITVEDPHMIPGIDAYQVRLIARVIPASMTFDIGDEADEIEFRNPLDFRTSEHQVENRIWQHSMLVKTL